MNSGSARRSRTRLSHIAALDGVRAVAIAAVLLFHLGLPSVPGGFLGVDVFFVLSGYLITTLLAREFLESRTIDVRAFYVNRARRLLPAIAVMAFVIATLSSVLFQDAAESSWRDLPWVMSGLSNWWLIFHNQSYFESIGRPPLFQHTWSLAVEAQFYLLWPFLLAACMRRSGIKLVLGAAAVCACASSAAFTVIGILSGQTASGWQSHLYFGTDTHSAGLFVGSALAAARILRPHRSEKSSGPVRIATEIAAWALLFALFALFHVTKPSAYPTWLLAFPACILITTALVDLAARPELALSRALSWRPIRWLGERSYGIYLWHWPIFQVLREGIDDPLPRPLNDVLRIAITVIVAELSYRFVEMPVRRRALDALWVRFSSWKRSTARWAAAGAVVAALSVGATEAVLAHRAIDQNTLALASYEVDEKTIAPPVSEATQHSVTPSRVVAVHHGALGEDAALVGDSIMLGVSPFLKERLRVVRVDAAVSRQAIPTRDVIASMVAAGEIEPVMIVDLGNNGTVEEGTLRSILTLLRKCDEVVIVDARVPRPWQDDNNALMRSVVHQYPNAVLADWNEASEGHPEYFGADGVHPSPEGARAYAEVIISALRRKAVSQTHKAVPLAGLAPIG